MDDRESRGSLGDEEIDLPRTFALADAAQMIEACAASAGLRPTQRGTLSEHPGSIHWHWKRGTEPGTLEITLLNRERRILISVRKNRVGSWTDSAREAIAERLRKMVTPDAA